DKNILGIEDEVLQCFYQYPWIGNVRELENSIEAAMNYVPYNRRYLKKEDFISCPNIITNEKNLKTSILDMDKSLPDYLEEIEKKVIKESLEGNDNNISQTAKELGIKRQTLQYKIKKYLSTAK
ncbi:MAG TPA: helix-turn-helix domain-containing protein, partial [Tissierellaceae bacterium]|nr:helix-turn-helix domain-containing protein [Tissierellaceae bacterium]